MSDAADFLEVLRVPGTPGSARQFAIGVIPAEYAGGMPTVKFDGEAAAGARRFPYLASYAPVANDRVLVALVGRGGVILGKIKTT